MTATLLSLARTADFLDLEEEQACYARMKAGSKPDRDRLTLSHLPLAVRLAKKWARPNLDLNDLATVATIGLIRAVMAKGYDPTKAPLRKRCLFQINDALRQYVEESGPIRRPRRRDRATAALKHKAELARHVVSLHDLAKEHDAYDPPDTAAGPAEQAEINDDHARLIALIDTLPEKQRDVAYNVYIEGMPVGEAGKYHGMNKDQSSWTHRQALRALAAMLAAPQQRPRQSRRCQHRGEPAPLPLQACL